MKKRTDEPWIPAPAYGGLLPQFTVNLIVRDVARALHFYEEVLQAYVHYSDPDFAAVRKKLKLKGRSQRVDFGARGGFSVCLLGCFAQYGGTGSESSDDRFLSRPSC